MTLPVRPQTCTKPATDGARTRECESAPRDSRQVRQRPRDADVGAVARARGFPNVHHNRRAYSSEGSWAVNAGWSTAKARLPSGQPVGAPYSQDRRAMSQ